MRLSKYSLKLKQTENMFVALLITLAASSTGLKPVTKPEFDFPFQNVTRESGTRQYLECKAKGEKPMTYKWYNQKGEEITVDYRYPVWAKFWGGHSFLVFNGQSSADEGSYTCTASNAHGMAKKVFSLRVIPPPSGLKPEFDFPFQNMTLESGMEKVLWCGAQGQKPITYKWYKQAGDEISAADYRQPLYLYTKDWKGGSFLYFSKLHEGSYKCTASNVHGQASRIFSLRYPTCTNRLKTVKKPEFDLPFQNVTRESGTRQSLECKAKGEKPMTYKWYNQKGKEITVDNRYPVWAKYWAGHTFLIFNVQRSADEGSYTCTASNAHGMARKVFSLRVVPPPSGLKPEFDFPFQNVTLESGMEMVLWCGGQGQKPITYKWYKEEGDEISAADYRQPLNLYTKDWKGGSFLYFSKLHEGSYKCTASNIHGQASRMFSLRFPCSNLGNDTDIDEDKGTSRFLDAKVLKHTARSVTFYITTVGPVKYIEVKYKEVKRAYNVTTIRLDPVPGNIYVIGILLPCGLYSFQFRTVPSESNDWSREYNVTLHPDTPDLPDAPQITLQKIGGRKVKLQWLTKTDDLLCGMIDRYQIKYFAIEMVDGDNWKSRNCSVTFEVPTCVGSSYTILELEQTIFYQIEVRAHNEAGYGEPWRQRVYLP